MSKDSAHMKHSFTVVVMSLTTVAMAGCSDTRLSVSAAAAAANRVQRGKYLVSVVGCSDCHTPMKMGPNGPEPDLTRFLSGHPEQMGSLSGAKPQGPWGVSYAANLTPDQNTGLGIWTEDMFVKAIRTGRHMGASRKILPPMPWPAFRNASDEDLKAVYAYLRSVPPVANHVPDVQATTTVDMTAENR